MSRARSKEQVVGEASVDTVDTFESIRVTAWAELFSPEGATDWRLLRRVLQEIEDMERNALVLCLKKMATYMDASGKAARPLEITAAVAKRQVVTVEFEDGSEVVDIGLVLPSNSEMRLVKSEQASHEALPSKELALQERHQIEAFFAKRADDDKIDVHAEGQLMMRTIKNPGNTSWDCSINPQPTLKDLMSSIARAKERNMRVLHLSGHGNEEHGFVWNADDRLEK